jgi:uncharacterized protein (TIGR02646 family)
MIQVYKAMLPPGGLVTAGEPARQALETLHDQLGAPACQQPGNRLLNVPATIYNDDAVKRQLIADQHGKCCYCEAYLLHVGYGDVEHYRPKNGFKQATTEAQLGKPGYYWLAYDWDNLLFVCDRCNRGHKRNYFPLRNPNGRVRSHHTSIGQEQPLLLHPAFQNPEPHIEFRKGVAKGKTPQGRATIRMCGLNRPKTREHRQVHFGKLVRDELLADLNLAALNDAEKARLTRKYGSPQAVIRRIRQARQACADAVLASAEYAGMAREYLAGV